MTRRRKKMVTCPAVKEAEFAKAQAQAARVRVIHGECDIDHDSGRWKHGIPDEAMARVCAECRRDRVEITMQFFRSVPS